MSDLPPVSVIELFPGERQALLALLSGLSGDQWAAPAACPGWSVHDVALHLLADDVGRLSGGRDGYRGSGGAVAAAGVDPPAWDQLVAFIDRRNQAWVEATRRISPRLLCELLGFTGEATATYFAGLDLQRLGQPVSWAGPEPAPVWLDLAREYTERWVHHQHIRDAAGRPGLKEARWLGPVLATFVRALPRTLRAVAAPPGTSVQLSVTGEAGGVWWAVRTADGWSLVGETGHVPEAIVTMDQETAWRLFTKGLSKEEAAGRVRLEGDPTLTVAMLDMVSIIA